MEALRILVVEDEPLIGLLFADLLDGMGHSVCAIAANENDAVAAAARHRPDLMIVDVRLGLGSGLAAVAEILRTRFIHQTGRCDATETIFCVRPHQGHSARDQRFAKLRCSGSRFASCE
jgi:CheY-like chemotaxis protein